MPLVLPLLCLPAGVSQYPFADRHDKAGLFCDWDEIHRRDQPLFGMLPANQSLTPMNPA